MAITVKGGIFSMDLLLAFLLVSCILSFCVRAESNVLFQNTAFLKSFFLEEKALLVADSLVKNNAGQNPLLGSAFFDSEKRRIVSNLVSLELLSKSQPVSFGTVEIARLSLLPEGFAETVFFEKEPLDGKDCVVARRFVLVKETLGKAIVEVTACES